MPSNGEILDLLQKKIEDGLKVKRISRTERLSLEVQQLFVLYMQDDHPKTQAMWRVFQPALWAAGVILTSFIGLAVSGKIEIIIR